MEIGFHYQVNDYCSIDLVVASLKIAGAKEQICAQWGNKMDLYQLPLVCCIQLHRFILSQRGDLVKIHLVALMGGEMFSNKFVHKEFVVRQVKLRIQALIHIWIFTELSEEYSVFF